MRSFIFLLPFLMMTGITVAQNVGIGTTNLTGAKLTVDGAAGSAVGLFKNGSGISLNVSSNNENVGLNMGDGRAIVTGNGGRLFLSNSASTGGIGLQYYSSTAAGVTFPSPINILRHTDNRWANSGHWIDMLYDEPGRIMIANQLYNKANGTLNMVPIGAVYFEVTNMHNGSGATRVMKNAGNGGTLYHSVDQFYCEPGDPILRALVVYRINLDFITKEYDDIYIVGSPNFYGVGTDTYGCVAEFLRKPATQRDQIDIYYSASRLYSDSKFFGTLMIYGNRTLN